MAFLRAARWVRTNGPEGGTINCFAADGPKVYAGTNKGIFLSTNDGSTWSAVNTELDYVRCLFITPRDSVAGRSIILAGTYGSMFRSTDQGSSWEPIGPEGVTAIAANPDGHGRLTLFAGTTEKVGGAIYLSTDAGSSWKRSDSGPNSGRVNSFAITVNGKRGSNMFVAAGSSVFRSANDGVEWIPVNTGLRQYQTVNSLAVMDSVIFAATHYGLFLSTNQGESWIEANKGLTNTYVQTIVVDGSNIFSGTSGGVFLSTDKGSHWTTVNMNLTKTNIRSLIVSGKNILAGTDASGVFVSTNKSSTWNESNKGLTGADINALAVSGSTVFAGTKGRGVFRSTDDGKEWNAVNKGLPEKLEVTALAVSGRDIYAGSFYGVFLSTNNGASWKEVGLKSNSVNTLTVNGSKIYAGTHDSWVFESIDKGSHWKPVNTGLPGYRLTSISTDGHTVFAGTDKGLFSSADSVWTNVSPGIPSDEILSVTVAPNGKGGSQIYAGTVKCLYVSTDGGSTWTTLNKGLEYEKVQALAAFPNAAGNFFIVAATKYGGVYVYTRFGWTEINSGIGQLEIRCFAIIGSTLFAGTECGVIKLNLP
jgi:photosystem II stability/assembly factor-like uncharacterized protein